MWSLNLSATCWASLKLFGMTRCTRTPLPFAARPPATGRRAIAHADDRRALLGGDREVLRRTHRKLPQTVLCGQLRERREPAPRVLRPVGERRHRHQPDDRHRAALQEPAELAGRDPALALLA